MDFFKNISWNYLSSHKWKKASWSWLHGMPPILGLRMCVAGGAGDLRQKDRELNADLDHTARLS